MRVIAIAAALALTVAHPANSPSGGFQVWTASQLKDAQAQLAGKIDAQKFAARNLGTFGNHSFMLAHREGNGQVELHETQNDVFFVQSGRATLVVGGTVVQPKTTAPHEVRGSSIDGGERQELGPGDVVHIQAGVPHQLLVDAGNQFTYFVVKVDTH